MVRIDKKVQIVFFSGTGSTSRVAACIEKKLLDKGVEVQKSSLDMQEKKLSVSLTVEKPDLIFLLFPVHAFDAPEPVYDWLDQIPNGDGVSVVILPVSGGGEICVNAACRIGCVKAFEQKGYNVIYERMIIMPSNFVMATKEELALKLLQILPLKVDHIIMEIESGIIRRIRPNIISKIMTSLFKFEKKSAKKFGKDLQVRDSCTGCGWCVNNCPRNNIEMIDNRPLFGGDCIICMRCIYGCPTKAIYSKHYGFITIKEGYDLNKLETNMGAISNGPKDRIKTGVLFKGVGKYLMKIES